MTVVLVSPAEPQRVRSLLSTRVTPTHTVKQSGATEQRGVDFLWRGNGAWWGVQRKELKDLLASLQDGRLERELGQMRGSLELGVVVVERHPQWTGDGELLDEGWGWTTFTHKQWVGLQMGLIARGVGVVVTRDARETVEVVASMVDWTQKREHRSLLTRPGPSGSGWGRATSEDWCAHLLQGFEGIGPGVAREIVGHFGGVPLRWDVSAEELMEVKGVGKGRAKKLMEALEKHE